MGRPLYIALAFLVFFIFRPSSTYAYVDVERAEFWHFLVSRYGQLYAPSKLYGPGLQAVDWTSRYITNPKIKAGYTLYAPELAPHFGWRLGCNIGWEIAGAAISLRNHESVNLVTIFEDSLSPGLLLYPFGQVLGQHIGGDMSHKLMNRAIAKWMPSIADKFNLKPALGALLIEEKGVPYIWPDAKPTVQKAASRFFGLGLGTYLAWSLFDYGHYLTYGNHPLVDAFKWSKYKALAMAGFTYGGYLGHNAGFALSHKKALPMLFASGLYRKLAEKAQTTLIKHGAGEFLGPQGSVKMADLLIHLKSKGMPLKKNIEIKTAARILDRDYMLWRGSQYLAAPLNALFCVIMAEALPAGLKYIERKRTVREWEFVHKEMDSFEVYSSLETDAERQQYVDEILGQIDVGYESLIESLSSSFKELAPNDGTVEDLSQSEIETEEFAQTLKEGKGFFLDVSILLGGTVHALLNIAHQKIDGISSETELINFMSDEFLPLLGLKDYRHIFATRLSEALKHKNQEKIEEIKENLHVIIESILPELYIRAATERLLDTGLSQ